MRERTWRRLRLVSVMVCAAMFWTAGPAPANHVNPIFVPGNPTCAQLVNDPDVVELRIQPVVDGTYTLNGFSVTIDVRDTAQGQVFDFTSNTAVDAVFVKGGPNGNLYVYDPPVTTDTSLHAPLNTSNNRWFGLSHLSFCFVPRPGTALTLSSSSPAVSGGDITIHSGGSVTLTFAETNNGNQNLTGANVTADNGCTPAFASGDDGDGILEPGETWLFTCTITNVTSDRTITAIGHGTDSQGRDVTWCPDPANPPANTLCDQDERVQVPIDVINPSTALSLQASSPAASGGTITTSSGGTVTLTFAETNNGDVPLTSPTVTADNGCTPAFVSGDDGDGVLEPGETWLFTCTITNVTTDTTVTAIGSGVDPLGFTVTWCQDPANPPANTRCSQGERVQVPIDVINPSTVLTLQSSSPAASGGVVTVASGGSVTLTFAETNNGDAPLTSATVTADNGCTPVFASGDDGDGVLEPGESWLFTCTITNVTAPVTVTAIGTGVDPLGRAVTWCQDPANPPANTRCSQSERVEVPIVLAPAGEGCTPGFWRNHPELWDGAGTDDVTTTIQTSDLFNATFGVTIVQSGLLNTVTLFDAVNLGGGGKNALARHAAAALASADSGIDYAFTVEQVIAIYRDAVGADAGPETVSSALLKFSTENERGCPLS